MNILRSKYKSFYSLIFFLYKNIDCISYVTLYRYALLSNDQSSCNIHKDSQSKGTMDAGEIVAVVLCVGVVLGVLMFSGNFLMIFDPNYWVSESE